MGWAKAHLRLPTIYIVFLDGKHAIGRAFAPPVGFAHAANREVVPDPTPSRGFAGPVPPNRRAGPILSNCYHGLSAQREGTAMLAYINSIILAGFGGMLPTTAQLAASYAAVPEQPLPHWHFLLAVALFFCIGAVLSIAFNKEADLGKAIVIGISAPAIITNIINGATSGLSKAPQPVPQRVGQLSHDGKSWLPAFVSSAFAQQNPSSGSLADNTSGRKSIVLTTAYAGQGRPENGVVTITAIAKDGSTKPLGAFGLSQFVVLPVPGDAEKLRIQAGSSFSRELVLWPQSEGPPSFAVNVRLIGKTSGAGDVLWALGAERKTSAVDADITTIPLSSYAAPTVTDAGATTCDDEKKLTSLSGERPAKITFTNDTAAPRTVSWINYSCQRVLYQILQPGQHYTQPTYITHPWVVTDNEGVCKNAIVAQQPDTDFQIRN